MKGIFTFMLALTLFASPLYAQKKNKKNDKKEEKGLSSATLGTMKFRSIGPSMVSGRIIDLAVNPKNHSEYYVAVASGGVFKTSNGGVTFKPIFDNQRPYSIGCVALAPSNSNIVWVGSGENNSQRSVSWGDGVYKSMDGGKTWKNMGLPKSEHIGNIVIHPTNPQIVFVAAQGPLWGPGGDRGVYKSIDGGESWEQVLKISENTGANVVLMDPRNPEVLYASSYQRRRHVYTLINGGPEAAIHKSIDGGKTWRKLTNGLPSGDVGRIGMAISPANPDYLYAIIELPGKKGGTYRSTDRGESWTMMSDYVAGSPQYYNELICDPLDENLVYSMDTYSRYSLDGGKTWIVMSTTAKHVDDHALWIDPNNTLHLLNGNDGGVYESWDRGQTWDYKQNLPLAQFYRVAVDNDKPFYNVYGGTQDNNSVGGPNQTINNSGIVNSDWYILHGGDGFEPACDPTDPNIVYAQSQHGWLVRYNRRTGEEVIIKPSEPDNGEAYKWNWDSPLIISPHNPARLYFAANKIFKSDDRGNTWKEISPDLSRQLNRNEMKIMGKVQSPEAVAKNSSTSVYGNLVSLSESPKKAGLIYAGSDDGLISISEDDGSSWRKVEQISGVPRLAYVSDLFASQHDENTVYASFENHKDNDFKPYLLKSTDKGKTWKSIVNDLPTDEPIWCIEEDHVDPNLLFVGTEYGLYFSNNGGHKWIRLKAGLPSIAIRDIDIQREENDLVLASYGRGFYILDDYTPLRTVEQVIDAKNEHIFPIAEAHIYNYRRPWGWQKRGIQGDNFYSGNNPEKGAVIRYYLPEGFSSLKAERKKTEKEATDKGIDISYPSFEALRAEMEEEKSYVAFLIKDEAGKTVRKLKSTYSKGMHKLVWDLKYQSNYPVGAKPGKGTNISNNGGAGYVVPGTYTVEMMLVTKDKVSMIGNKQSFKVSALHDEYRADMPLAMDFRQELNEFNKVYQAMNTQLNNLDKRVNTIRYALEAEADVKPEMIYKARQLQLHVDSLKEILSGDKVRKKHYADYAPGLSNRWGMLMWGTNSHSELPTQTIRNDFKIVKNRTESILKEIERIRQEEITALEKELNRVGAPYTPGRN